jgi:hypothetical protein
MIRAHDEGASLEVGALVAENLDEPDELVLVCSNLEMTGGKRLAEEGEWSSVMMEDSAEAGA